MSAYHPQIGSIIRFRDQIYVALFVRNNIDAFLSECIGLMGILKPGDYSTELEEAILEEQKWFDNNKSIQNLKARKKNRRKTYTKWFRDLNEILWDKKYLENRTYAPETKKDTLFKEKEVKKWNEP